MILNNLKKNLYIIDDKSKKKIWLILTLSIIGTFLELLGVGIVIPLVSLILDKENFLSTIQNYDIFKDFDFLNNDSILPIGLLFLITVFLIKNLYLAWFSYVKSKYALNIQVQLSKNLLKSYYSLEYINLISRDSSIIIRNCLKEVGIFSKTFQEYINLFIDCSIILSILVFMQTQLPFVTLGVFLILSFVILIYFLFIKKYLYELGQNRLNSLGLTIEKLNQFIFSLKEIKIFNKKDKLFKDFNDNNFKAQNFARIKMLITDTTRYFLEIFVIGLIILIIYFYAFSSKSPNEVIIALSFLVAASFKIFPSMNKINGALQAIRYNSPSTDVLYNEISYFKELRKNEKKIFPFPSIETVEGKNIFFNYEKNNNVLNDINFKFDSGQTIGVYGSSGKGKTTLCNIIVGLIKQSSGKIFLNSKEVDLTEYDMTNIVGYVPQNSFLINDTILNNIALGEFENKINLDKVHETIKETYLEPLIKNLKNGIYTDVGENGIKLSGGQKQRLCIARALYKKPQILIFDEPTSSLDAQTSEEVMKNILNMKKILKIIITHKEQDLNYFDKIIKV